MKNQAMALGLLLASLACFGGPASAQSLLNQSSADLMKDFDVDPAYMQKYPAGNKQNGMSTVQMIGRLIGNALPKVNINNTAGDTSIRVKAPFVNVSVGTGMKDLLVKAPFISLDNSNGMSFKAPFVNFGPRSDNQLAPQNNLSTTDAADATLRISPQAPTSLLAPSNSSKSSTPTTGDTSDYDALLQSPNSQLDLKPAIAPDWNSRTDLIQRN